MAEGTSEPDGDSAAYAKVDNAPSTTASVPHNSDNSPVSWSNEDGDSRPGSALSVDLANDRITIEETGVYLATLVLTFSDNASAAITQATINVDGASYADRSGSGSEGSGGISGVDVTAVVVATSPPTHVSAGAFHQFGSSTDLDSEADSTFLEVVRLGDL